MALTNILLMDKIDLDTLRAPLGIRLPAPLLLPPHSSDSIENQSLIFAEIAQSDEVARLDHADDQSHCSYFPPRIANS
ncbi:hypothetical protein EDB86DRAFT_3081702 [Lactarius hatsudake]|nr:hypothetical protein EDB86DRAFT_3081702 [Lactarius hatsudake]